MTRRPRDPKSPILTQALIRRILLVGLLLFAGSFGLFEWELYQGESYPAARTAAVNVLVFGELFYLFNCRSLGYSMFKLGVFSNPWLFVGVITMVALQLAFTYLPAMQHMFGTASLGITEWMLIMAVGMVIYTVVEIEKKVSQLRAVSS
jgi:Ca2+-transporting ATPase